MPLYRYKAVDAAGAVSIGDLEAPQESAVVERLRDLGLMPIRVEQSQPGEARTSGAAAPLGGWFRRRGISDDEILAFTRELATLLKAGLPLDRALQVLINLAPPGALRDLQQQVRDDLRGGSSLSQALEAQRGHFSRFYVNIVRAGEAGGALPLVLGRLAEFLERARELGETVKSALIYPVILVVVSVAALMALLIFVVPQFQQMFQEAGKALPLPTQIVIAVGDHLRHYWWTLLIAAFVLRLWWREQMAKAGTRKRWDARALRLPLVGDLIAKVETARFARTLGTLLGNGVSLLNGMLIVKETLSNTVLAQALDGVIVKLREGRGLGQPLLETGLYPPLAIHMVLVGEETGRLEEMLLRVADVYDREVQTAVKRMLALLEPALILGLAAMVGTIILSILIALLSVNDLAF
ncbi:Type II secretion system protein F [Burkholderiales bacterium]|nr:MAG: type II secretion system F family protein [Burkholderiales bacterium]CAG1011550.1 Type II secretion system protein F [Burkholderiales bacterium]